MARPLVGIDIGSGSCKMAVRDGGICLVSRRLPDNLVAGGDIIAPETMVKFLKNVRAEGHIKPRDCVMVLPDSKVFFHHVSMPSMSAAELELNLPYEFRDFIKGDPAEYIFDYAVDDASPSAPDDSPLAGSSAPAVSAATAKLTSPRLELYAAAVRKDLVDQAASVLKKAGFRLKQAIPPAMAYARLLRSYAESGVDGDRSVIFVDIGYSSVSAFLFSGTRFQASKSIDLGCRDIDRAIANLKGVDLHVASTYREANFEGVLDSPECMTIYGGLAIEIAKVIHFYNFNSTGKEVDGMYLLGGGAEIPQLAMAIAAAIPVKVDSIGALLPGEVQGSIGMSSCGLSVAALLEGEAV